MHEQFEKKRFSPESRRTLSIINSIIEKYRASGYALTVRQLYYQLVSANVIVNTERSYKCLVGLVNNARLAGLIDWSMIKDRGRGLLAVPHWVDPAHAIDDAYHNFRLDKWIDQPNYIVCMVEKQALEDVLHQACTKLDVPFCSNKGYSSATALYDLGKIIQEKRFGSWDDEGNIIPGKSIHVIYLGDHDPSGIDMTRDITDRIELFSRGMINVHRIALNMDQIEEYNPPENPAKTTDSRYEKYIKEYGESSWELDALPPTVIGDLITNIVVSLRDNDKWEAALKKENDYRESLRKTAERYRNHEID